MSASRSCVRSTDLMGALFNRIIGLSDGLTVPFALTAGLSSIGDSRIVVMGGLAELIAGAISMGVGGFREWPSYETSIPSVELDFSIYITICVLRSRFAVRTRPLQVPPNTNSAANLTVL